MAAKAVAFAEALKPDFSLYSQKVATNAHALAEGLVERNARLVSGGTDNHLVLMDVSVYGLTGRQAEAALLEAGIVTNRNTVPEDPEGPWFTAGIRLGTPALTTRGFDEAEMKQIAVMIDEVLSATRPAQLPDGSYSKAKYEFNEVVRDTVHAEVEDLLQKHPLYPEIQL
jgi:glycine hydroxymethyltransferase